MAQIDLFRIPKRPIADHSSTCFHREMTTVARSRNAIFDHVASVLRRVSAVEAPIAEPTELYYDLHLAGDDLYDAIDEIRNPFGTDFSVMDLRRYAPNEVGHNISFLNLARRYREWRGERTYQSLTVARLIDAVQAGAWSGG
jgi:hypothetical protein